MEQDLLIVVLSPIITAAVAGLGLLIKEWRDNRRWEHRRSQVLDQGTKQVTFIASWLTAYSTLGEDQRHSPEHRAHLDRARTDLDEVYESVNARVEEVERQRPVRTTWASLISSVLLLGVRRPWAKVVRVAYLGVLTMALALGLLMATTSVEGSGLGWLWQVGLSVAFTAFYLVPAGLLHVLARFLDRPPRSAVAHDLAAPGWPVVPGGGV